MAPGPGRRRKRAAALAAALAAAAGLVLAVPARAQAPAPPEPELARHPAVAAALGVLDAWIAARVADRELPGLSVGIVHDQTLLWARGYGAVDAARGVAATPATAYRIGSITKLFTATAVLQLRDAGRLRLDDPVDVHLPWFRMSGVDPEAPAITIRHLLTHTAGVPREAPGFVWSDARPVDPGDLRRLLPVTDVTFPAERRWKYSNLGYGLLGEVVAAAAGQPWGAYVEERVLRPLGMHATRALPAADMPGLAASWGRRRPGLPRLERPHVDLGWLSPAGSLASTVEDLARFVALQFRDAPAGGAQVLKGATLREMHRLQRGREARGQGLGFAVWRVAGDERVGHGGAVAGFQASLSFSPASRLGVVALASSTDGGPGRVVEQAFAIVGPAVAQATRQPPAVHVADPAWAAYVGSYRARPDSVDMEVRVLDGELALVSPDDDNPWAERVVLRPVGPHTFRMEGGWAAGELLRFEVDAAGRATRITGAGGRWNRRSGG